MKANPGGQIDSANVIGRDALIAEIWEIIQQQSIRMTAERRIGKTTVIKKMQDEPHPGWRVKYRDLERVHTAAEFALSIYKDVDEFLATVNRAGRRATELIQMLGGMKLPKGISLPEKKNKHWKDIIEASMEDLIQSDGETSDRLLFLWDEVPYMLQNICEREGESVAMEVLDVLRGLRQSYAKVRMIITGSIGLHHVFSSLKGAGYANAPVNDMCLVKVLPLSKGDAGILAKELIVGENLDCADLNESAELIAELSDCFPFYIHHIVRGLKSRDLPANPKEISSLLSLSLIDENDPWELMHYLERIEIYYRDRKRAVYCILDELAVSEKDLSVNMLSDALKKTDDFGDREELLKILRLMRQDHYLSMSEKGEYSFCFPLIRRWWILSRGLDVEQ
jgi:hypothetical protein